MITVDPEFNPGLAHEETWEALLRANAFVEADAIDPHIFADGSKATLKIDAEALVRHPRELDIVLGHVASLPCVKQADTLLYVPRGMRDPAVILGHELGKPVVHANRQEGKGRYDFEYQDEENQEIALAAMRPTILEDVVTTLGSVAGMVRLLDPLKQDINSVAYILRGSVKPEYQIGVHDHYLMRRAIPTDKEQFRAQLEPWEAEIYKPRQKRVPV